MNRPRNALGTVLAVPGLLAALATFAFADPAKLAAGQAFPPVDAQSLAGSVVRLPSDEQGRPFVIDIERAPYSEAEAHRITEEFERRDATPK